MLHFNIGLNIDIMNYKYYFLFAWCLISVNACDLTKEPLDFLEANAYYDTAEKLESNLAAVYDKLGHRDLYGQWMNKVPRERIS